MTFPIYKATNTAVQTLTRRMGGEQRKGEDNRGDKRRLEERQFGGETEDGDMKMKGGEQKRTAVQYCRA